ncbi:MAG: hypothetical protein WD003_00820 [Candidatus Paceibacterota bacterium]
MKSLRLQHNKGASLLEIFLIGALLSFLVALISFFPGGSQDPLRDEIRLSDIQTLTRALEVYHNENKNYPSTNGQWWGVCDAYGKHPRSGANGWVPNIAPRYLPELPIDPAPIKDYGCYLYRSDGVDYKLLVHHTIESLNTCPQNTPAPAIPKDHPYYDPVRSSVQCSLSSFSEGAKRW